LEQWFAMAKKKKVAAKTTKTSDKLKEQRIAKTGLTTRIRGHVSARGRRAQGRRDSR
jgi:hypothetical protein